MIFAGRKIETSKIIKELQQGHNIILEGKYGIGRTSLVQHTASLLIKKWQFIFIDFSQTPGQISKILMKELGLPRKLKKSDKTMGYKSMRYRIANAAFKEGVKKIIVLDNIAKITSQKKLFLRYLILEQHFQFVAIAEHFLAQKDLLELRAQLMPSTIINLRYLDHIEVENLLQIFSNQYGLNWTEDYIRNLASLTSGYPLGITEMLRKKRKGPCKYA
jgi:hypothetical protein